MATMTLEPQWSIQHSVYLVEPPSRLSPHALDAARRMGIAICGQCRGPILADQSEGVCPSCGHYQRLRCFRRGA